MVSIPFLIFYFNILSLSCVAIRGNDFSIVGGRLLCSVRHYGSLRGTGVPGSKVGKERGRHIVGAGCIVEFGYAAVWGDFDRHWAAGDVFLVL